METHAGYMGGLKREFCANCTLPYYATSSEEVLFHVSTRMPPKLEQKVMLSPYGLLTAVCRLEEKVILSPYGLLTAVCRLQIV